MLYGADVLALLASSQTLFFIPLHTIFCSCIFENDRGEIKKAIPPNMTVPLEENGLFKKHGKAKAPEKIDFSGALFNIAVVTRWRFELQTHCLKGNCSAN